MATSSQPSVIRHIVTDTDTLESIAFQYLGDTDAKWDIATYNNLDEPYISCDPNFIPQTSASGVVLFTRSQGLSSNLTIPSGTAVATPVVEGLPMAKTYVVQQDTMMMAGQASVLAYVVCTLPGTWGNNIAGEIRAVAPMTMGTTPPAVQALLVTNPAAFVNGQTLNVKQPGDVIFVPVANGQTAVQFNTEGDFMAAFGGTDLALTSDGDFIIDAYGDLASTSGLDNMQDAAFTRLSTKFGELPLHPDYGSDVKSVIGEPNVLIQPMLMNVAIKRAILQDDRFSDVTLDNLTISGSTVTVEPNITLATGEQQQMTPIKLT